jgi:hypothetical protein
MVVVSMAATRAVAGQQVREKRSRTQVEISSIFEWDLSRNFAESSWIKVARRNAHESRELQYPIAAR